MVRSDKEKKRMEAKMKESEMIDEGGLGVEENYNYDDAKDDKDKKPDAKLESAEMVDEGGLGANLYYDKEEMIAVNDAENSKEDESDN